LYQSAQNAVNKITELSFNPVQLVCTHLIDQESNDFWQNAIPAQAGIQFLVLWIPACAGMTLFTTIVIAN
jgi:hypothetical protein